MGSTAFCILTQGQSGVTFTSTTCNLDSVIILLTNICRKIEKDSRKEVSIYFQCSTNGRINCMHNVLFYPFRVPCLELSGSRREIPLTVVQNHTIWDFSEACIAPRFPLLFLRQLVIVKEVFRWRNQARDGNRDTKIYHLESNILLSAQIVVVTGFNRVPGRL